MEAVLKLRTDFVTNSSSTSFVLITAQEFSLQYFLEVMGVCPTSPFVEIFEGLYYSLSSRTGSGNHRQIDWEKIEARQPPHVRERIKQAREDGHLILFGKLSSDQGTIESFFCTDSFEVTEEGFFLSALENYW